MERLLLTIDHQIIYPHHLPSHIYQQDTLPLVEPVYLPPETHCLKLAVEQVEIQLLKQAKQQCKTTYEMAHFLNISQPTVMYKLKNTPTYFNFKPLSTICCLVNSARQLLYLICMSTFLTR